MKKGFTLVEMLIVVVIIVILMSIVFRLSGILGDEGARSETIMKMQKLENCLSGYYAAFGSYPPVALHASQNPFRRYNKDELRQEDDETSSLNWDNVEAACRAQPFAARFPFKQEFKGLVRGVFEYLSQEASRGRLGVSPAQKAKILQGADVLESPNEVPGWDEYDAWNDVKIFQFGVMSYLAPRYLFMTSGLKGSDFETLKDCKQWTGNNRLAANQNLGELFTDWGDQLKGDGRSPGLQRNLLERIPSQSATARWLPNLEGICGSTDKIILFGVLLCPEDTGGCYDPSNWYNAPGNIQIYKGHRGQYVLDGLSVWDGWGSEFYYYSEPPYQSYRLWSSGKNAKTFPPWYSMEDLNTGDRKTAADWVSDDIMFMNN